VSGETARALRRRLLFVPGAVPLVLLSGVLPPGGQAGLVEERCADAPSAHEVKELLDLAGRNPGVITGRLAARVAKGHYSVAQAGYQGRRRIFAEFPGVTSNHPCQPLVNTSRPYVVQLVKGRVGEVAVLHGVEGDDVDPPGVSRRRGGRRRWRRGSRDR